VAESTLETVPNAAKVGGPGPSAFMHGSAASLELTLGANATTSPLPRADRGRQRPPRRLLTLVRGERRDRHLITTVDTGSAPIDRVGVGATVPRGAKAGVVRLDDDPVKPTLRLTNRGLEVTVDAAPGRHVLDVATSPGA
jgi:hypothetical protein